ncbi:MAG TPA: isocitrate lyase/phosphoenolpyruvate mutase family protein [Candidatus Angelobacter sp.]
MTQEEKAQRLLALHHGEDPLVLINAWDAASACIVEQAGFPAIASSSAAVANALGYPDGQKIPWQEMLAAITRIASAVKVPVTADIEAGFADTPEELEKRMESVIEAGAVGVNLEDALPGHGDRGPLYSLPDQLARIQSTRKAGNKRGIHLVINARTDAYWQAGVTPEEALRNTLERGKPYLKAGGDCIFVPGLRDPAHIRTVVGELNAPVNILATTGAPSIPELKQLGVKRVSYGSGPMRAAMGLLRRIAREAQTSGTYTALLEGAVPYPQMNALFEK